MPEYLAPGVFVEETTFRAKSIEGVGTSTAAFVGMTARGPTTGGVGDMMPPLLTSFGEPPTNVSIAPASALYAAARGLDAGVLGDEGERPRDSLLMQRDV